MYMYIYIYIYVCMYVCMYVYTYIYIYIYYNLGPRRGLLLPARAAGVPGRGRHGGKVE